MCCCKQKGQNKEAQGKCCKSTRKQPAVGHLAPAKTNQHRLNSGLSWAIALLLYAFSPLACKVHAMFLECFEHFFAASGLSPLLPILLRGHNLRSTLCFGFWQGGLLDLVNLCSGDVHTEGDRSNHSSLSKVERR